jgi:hypothetical protein
MNGLDELIPANGHTITTAEYNAWQAKCMLEAVFQNRILTAARATGWLVYHTYDSRRSQGGYPDLHLVHAGRKISALRELKTQKGVVSPAQRKWIDALAAAGVDVDVWRPIHLFDGTIDRLLYGTKAPWEN